MDANGGVANNADYVIGRVAIYRAIAGQTFARLESPNCEAIGVSPTDGMVFGGPDRSVEPQDEQPRRMTHVVAAHEPFLVPRTVARVGRIARIVEGRIFNLRWTRLPRVLGYDGAGGVCSLMRGRALASEEAKQREEAGESEIHG